MLTKMTIISCLTLNISKANTLINGTNVDLGVLEVPDEVPEEVLADLPPGCKPLGCKWIFKRKLKVDGTIEKFKSRLVIRGFRQKSGINYFDTNALVARINTVRLLIALASVHQMDVKTAFLNVVLSSGYLLNQANKYVYSKFDESGKGVIICLYVDDMLIFGTNQVQIDLTKEFLSSRFSMKDMREADVLKKFDYLNYTPMSTPMDTSEKLKPNNGKVVSQLEYSMVIGCLMYAMTCTRPDIAFAKEDASWISNTKDNSFASGWVFLLGGCANSWASKKQTCITSSTIKYEFVAFANAGKEAEWLKNLLLEIPLWSKPIAPIFIRCDSAATSAKAYS
ncbi:zinc finger, CCHC-type containing protein [Tanacetum coccineum]